VIYIERLDVDRRGYLKNMTQTPAEIAGDLKFLDAPEGKGFDWTYPKWKK
jgi:hypothetical protein